MRLNAIDWTVIAAVMGVSTLTAFAANRLTKSVSDYLVAGRSVGRMLTISSGTEWIGVVNIIAMFEIYYTSGFPSMWWLMLQRRSSSTCASPAGASTASARPGQ